MRLGIIAALWLIAGTAFSTPLSTIGTFCGTFPSQCQKGTESLMAVRGIGTNAYYVLEADVTTGALPVNVTGGTIVANNASVGPAGAAVPADGTYVGLNNGGNLIGAVGDSSGRTIVAGAGTAGSAAGGVLTVQGSASGTAVPVSGSVTVSGTVAATQSGTWTVQPGNTANTTPWLATISQGGHSALVSVGGALSVDASGSTQPVSGTVAVSNLPSTVDTNTGLIGSSTLRVAQGGSSSTTTIVASNPYASTNVTTSAYVQLIASTANAVNTICISSSNGANIKVATGANASEVDRIYLPGGGAGCYAINIPASTRVSLKAIDVTASTGYFLLTGY